MEPHTKPRESQRVLADDDAGVAGMSGVPLRTMSGSIAVGRFIMKLTTSVSASSASSASLASAVAAGCPIAPFAFAFAV